MDLMLYPVERDDGGTRKEGKMRGRYPTCGIERVEEAKGILLTTMGVRGEGPERAINHRAHRSQARPASLLRRASWAFLR